MINKKFLLFFLCILVLGIFTTACVGGGKAIPTPTPAKYPLELSQTQ